jgi:alanine dehydrogenase
VVNLVLFINNDISQKVLDMDLALKALEDAYFELGRSEAVYRPRIDIYSPTDQANTYYRWGTMEGMSRKSGVLAIRMKSDILEWQKDGTEDKYCGRPGQFCGLIFLVSTKDGMPLAILNDGYVQHMRVGAAAGLAAKYVSRKDSKILGMVGSGGMARTYAWAISRVRNLDLIKAYSPTPAHRKLYAEEMSKRLGIEVKTVDKPEEAVRGSDIVSTCTDSLVPVIKAEWLEPGMHVCNVRQNEVGTDVIDGADVLVRLGDPTLRFGEELPPGIIRGTDDIFSYAIGSREELARIPHSPHGRVTQFDGVTLIDIMAGKAKGRKDDRQITYVNNQGTQGLQFAAVGAAVYGAARAKNLGIEVPTEYFLQTIRD